MGYTAAQLRAFEWLPSDGDWIGPDIVGPGRKGATMYDLDSLAQIDNLVNHGWGTRENPRMAAYRLTPSGVAERARLVKEGVIK